ncbi:putative ribonuclease H-like domain-containing protein [Tanacetum coccineum]
MKKVNTFVDYRTELLEESSKKAETELEDSSKRASTELEQENTKKQKVDDDKETAELQSLMQVIPDEEEIAIDNVPLATKPPTIVDWKIHKEGKNSYYQIIRADGSSKMYKVFSQMLKSFDRQDLEDLYKLVKAKYGSTRPVEDLDLILYGDLKTMFNPYVEDQVWKNQQDYKLLDWKLYDSCRVHSLRMQHVCIHMLVEKRYPITISTIIDMLNKKLQLKEFDLLKWDPTRGILQLGQHQVITSFEYVNKIFQRRHSKLDMVIKSSKNEKEHKEHLKAILELLKKEDFQGIHVDHAKIESIKYWASPKTPTEICQILGLAGYYRRFIEGFSKIASAPILALPEGSKDFVVYCDASHKGLGDVLMQREKENVVADALRRKERIKPLRVRALVMTIGLDLPKQRCRRRSVSIRCQGYIGDFVLGSHAKDMVPYHQATLLTPIQKRIGRTWRRILLTILPMEEIILDNKSSDDDNNDDDVDKDEEDEEEEEHLTPADLSVVPTDDPVPSS